MVSGDREGSQGERRRAQETIQREQTSREAWLLLGDGDEHHRLRAHDAQEFDQQVWREAMMEEYDSIMAK